jgi:hypothetical protein
VLGKPSTILHLAFKGMDAEEVYDVLMEQFVRAAAKYDPNYTFKLQQVVETIDNALSSFPGFHSSDVDRHLEFSSHRYLRLLCRRGFLASEKQPGEKATYRRLDAWPPPADLFNNGAIGIAYYLQKWFQFYLQQWIDARMSEFEAKDGVYSLDYFRHEDTAGGPASSGSPRRRTEVPSADGQYVDAKGDSWD